MKRVCIAMVLAVIWLGGDAGRTDAQAGSAEASSVPWRTSWTAFADDVDAFRKTAPDFPSPSFQMLAGGQEVPGTFSVRRRYDGKVSWEGSFSGLETKESKGALLMSGQEFKLALEMPRVRQGWILHVYPTAASLDRWKAVAPGSAVRFTAQFKGVAGYQPLKAMIEKDQIVYYLLLTDAEPAFR